MGRGRGGQEEQLVLEGLEETVAADTEWSTADDLVLALEGSADPYAGVDEDELHTVSKAMLDLMPFDPDRLVRDIMDSYQEALQTEIAGRPISEMVSSGKIVADILHDLVVEAISKQPGFRPGENDNKEKDVVCIVDDKLSIEVKGNQSKGSVSGNKSYAVDNAKEGEGDKSRMSFYIIVNHDPSKGIIHRIGFAYLVPEDWEAYDKQGNLKKGQIVPLSKRGRKKICSLYER